MIIAQVTDSHMRPPGRPPLGDREGRTALERVLDALAAGDPRPDLVVFTGDLAEAGRPEEYARVRAALEAAGLRAAVIPGNHDRRDAMAEAFAGSAIACGAGGFLQFTIEDLPVRVICLDTLGDSGGSAGLLCAARLGWLAERLAEAPDEDAVIFMHHPPFMTGLAGMDRIACGNGAEMAAIVARHGRVLRVACGHVHRPVTAAFAATVGTICPAVSSQVPLDLAPGAPVRLLPHTPGYQLHVLAPEVGLVTHTGYLDMGKAA